MCQFPNHKELKNVKAKGLCISFQMHLFLLDKQITDNKQQLPLHLLNCSDESIFTAVVFQETLFISLPEVCPHRFKV